MAIYRLSKKRSVSTNGLVFYASLKSDSATAATGQAVSKVGTVPYDVVDGIPCASFMDNGRLYIDDSALPSGNSSRSISVWLKRSSNYNSNHTILIWGSPSEHETFALQITENNTLRIAGYFYDYDVDLSDLTAWTHIAVTYDSSTLKIYCNGVLKATKQRGDYNTQLGNNLCLGGWFDDTNENFYGWMSGLRIYDRCLTEEEVTVLLEEHSPSEADNNNGFDEFGYPIPYDSASAAGCNLVLIPTDGLVFYASLNNNSNVAETGQPLSIYGTVDYVVNDGIPCAYFDGGSALYYPYSSGEMPQGSQPSTLSVWAKVIELSSDMGQTFLGYGKRNVDNNNHRKMVLEVDEKFYIFNNSGGAIGTGVLNNYTSWHHYCVTLSEGGSAVSVFIDGVLKAAGSFTLNTDATGNICIGADPWNTWKFGKVYGYVSSPRIYNRVLSADEIQKLSKEFNI